MRGLPRFQPFESKISRKLIKERKIYLWSQVDDRSAQELVEKILFLESEDPGKEITFYINSPGGSVTSGMAILDAMNLVTSPISTVVMGMAASFGAVLLACGEKGRRFAFPHSRVMIHQPLISGQIVAPAADIKIHAEQIRKTRDTLNHILADASGQPLEKIEQDTDRDFFMNAEEATAYGLVDGTLDKL